MAERSVTELDLRALTARPFFPSPIAWEDEVLYFLMLDRFSDGRETGYRGNDGQMVVTGTTPRFSAGDAGNAPRGPWVDAGRRFCGGTLRGLTSKLGYLARLGISAIWISPIFKQLASRETYHGYGIQDFLDVDPRFGTRDELRDLVDTAHRLGLRVILDIILNHTGDVFAYDPDRYEERRGDGSRFFDPAVGWRGVPRRRLSRRGRPAHAAVRARQSGRRIRRRIRTAPSGRASCRTADTFTRKGHIRNWDFSPEFLEGDFSDLKNVHLGQGSVDDYRPSEALKTLAAIYKFWIAFADLDGFRIDTVKHMDLGASRYFGSVIHEFAQRIGKENFYLVAEITGGRSRAFQTLETTGLDAALGVDDIPDKVEYLIKGFRNPEDVLLALPQLGPRPEGLARLVSQQGRHDVRRSRSGPERREQGALLRRRRRLASGVERARAQCHDARHPVRVLRHRAGVRRPRPVRSVPARDDVRRRVRRVPEPRPAFLSRGRAAVQGARGRAAAAAAEARAAPRPSVPPRDFRRRRELRAAAHARVGDSIDRAVVADQRRVRDPVRGQYGSATRRERRGSRSTMACTRLAIALGCLYSTDAAEIGQTVLVEARNGKAVRLTVPPAGFVVYE